jgi:hypothetical protein
MADLQSGVEAWSNLPPAVPAGILAMVQASTRQPPLPDLSSERGTSSSSAETLVRPCGSDVLCGNLKAAVDRPFSVPQLEPFLS